MGLASRMLLKTRLSTIASVPLFWHYPNLYDMPPYSAVRQGELKLIYWHANQKIELFDLNKDIGEKGDLSQKRPTDVERLAKLLSDHLRKTKALMLIDKGTNQPIPLPDAVVSRPKSKLP